mgnify:CR=1 FL=1
MKKYTILIFAILTAMVFSCNKATSTNSTLENRKECSDFIKEVDKTVKEFKENKLSKTSYAKKMENFGDIFSQSTKIIPPKQRYEKSILCYSEALKYNRDNEELNKKLQKQKKTFQVVNIK